MKTIKIVKYFFSVIGLGMLIGAYFMFANTQSFLSQSQITQGTVVDLLLSRSSDSNTYRPLVAFTASDGSLVEITSSSSSNPPAFDIGEKVDVFYNPSFPEDAMIDSFFSLWGGAVILGGLGAVFFLTGASMIAFGCWKNNRVAYLKRNGEPVKAKLAGVQLNSSVIANGRNPYQITAQWTNPKTSKLHVFMSDNIWFDPSEHIKGGEVTVLIDQSDPNKYYMDISFLPQLAG
ncbi:DUF3592 domain-containing protein [Vibrio sp. V39_P1S14PM300]|uniref:DUF3592 domain-containing protein n=1 Tax=Vibrio sp. V39_P1S14PM300 TaxID=1938690 RepID=UPI0013730364|nr:DUF3592 domain-containing protein [Vibrio sp. V39_P1S14PM300]NAX22964.1 DUF3592 domain-containing protein [Vibrio sp. V39_P1S14PM300]